MVKIKRKKAPPHYVVTDTNCLWHVDKTYVVNPLFQEFLDSHANNFDLKLIIPEVVKGEMLYQHTSSTLRTLRRVNKEFDNLSETTGKDYRHRVTEARLRRDVQDRLDRWISRNSAAVENTPVSTINWENLVEAAIWRKPPFTEDKKTEKGFRDSLILECVNEVGIRHNGSEVAFICDDRLLREATDERLKSFPKYSSYENIQAFEAYLKLTLEQLTEDFVRSIQRKATEKFFSKRGTECLFNKYNIIKTIREKFPDKLKAPNENVGGSLSGLLSPSYPGLRWNSISNETIWIQKPQFQSLTHSFTYHWKSVVSFVELFESHGPTGPGIIGGSMGARRKLRILRFWVIWRVNVSEHARFTKPVIEDVDLGEEVFDVPTIEQLENYDITVKDAERRDEESNN